MASVIEPGTVLKDTYEVIKQIGAGGGGSIYLGYHKNLKTNIAIKKIHDKGKYDENEVFREAKILTQLRHSYLPRVYDFLILESGVYTVMDFIPGESIDDMIKRNYKFSQKEIIKFGTQLSEVLSYLHSQKPAIIHGDIKPANIMITPEGNICLIDFNISGMADAHGNAYVMGYSAGYAAPEQFAEYKEIASKLNAARDAWQARNAANEAKVSLGKDETVFLGEVEDKAETVLLDENVYSEPKPTMQSLGIKGIHIDPKSDVYSVGATLYHMVMGEKVSEDGTKKAPSNLNDGLLIILNKALSANPSKRYKDASELEKAFKSIYKLDRRYKRMMARKTLWQSFFIIMIGAGVVLAAYGVKLKDTEKSGRYQQCVDAIYEYGEHGDFDSVEEAFTEAIGLDNYEPSAYIAKAETMFLAGLYENTAEFIEDSVSKNSSITKSENSDYIYYLLGRAYYEMDYLENAVDAFSRAIVLADYNPDYYVFSALSLAQTGHPAQAEDALNKAIKLNAKEDYVLLLQGEIARQSGENDSAVTYLSECIEKTTDGYIRSRAYVFLSDVYKDQEKTVENVQNQIDILTSAATAVEDSFAPLITSRLSQAYLNMYSLTEDSSYADEALLAYKKLIKLGVADFTVYNNMVVLYERLERYDEATEVLDSIEGTYGNYYAFYKRRAMLEFRIQNTKGANMNFDKLEEYYEKAVSLYEKENDKLDAEMPVLEQTYDNYKRAIEGR